MKYIIFMPLAEGEKKSWRKKPKSVGKFTSAAFPSTAQGYVIRSIEDMTYVVFPDSEFWYNLSGIKRLISKSLFP
jgi:hypothetical protein